MDLTIVSSNTVSSNTVSSRVLSVAFGGAFVGETAALSAACLWAAATLMFGRIGKQLTPVVLNSVKGVFAIAMIIITLILRAQLRAWPIEASSIETLPIEALSIEALSSDLSASDIFYLLLSGGVGIGLGDTAYFGAINALGARRALLLETLAPPIAAVLAWIFLEEQLSLRAVTGIALTLAGVFWVISDRTEAETNTQHNNTQHNMAIGLGIAFVAVFCQAAGAVLSRGVLAGTEIDPLLSALLRLVAGLGFTSALMLKGIVLRCSALRALFAMRTNYANTFDTQHQQRRWHKNMMALRQPTLLSAVAISAFLGTYLGIWLQQISLKYTATGIAQSLLATSPLFVLPMAALLGDKVSYRAIFGAVIALCGVWILLAS